MLAEQLEEAVYGELDEDVRQSLRALNKLIIRKFDAWEKKYDPSGHTYRQRGRANRAAAEKFVKAHPEIVEKARKAREAVGTWDRFKSQLGEVGDALGSMGNDVITVIMGTV